MWVLANVCAELLILKEQIVVSSTFIYLGISPFNLLILFKILKSQDSWNIPELVSSLQNVTQLLLINFLVCEFGERVSREYEILHYELCKCEWYTLSIEVQRIYSIFLAHTQQTPNIYAFGHINCSRYTFMKVISKSKIL